MALLTVTALSTAVGSGCGDDSYGGSGVVGGGGGGGGGPSSSSSSSAGGSGGDGPIDGGSLLPCERCPGEEVKLTANDTVHIERATDGFHDDYRSYCGTGDVSAPDAVFAVSSVSDGTLHAYLASRDSDYVAVLYARTICSDSSTARACSTTANSDAEVIIPLKADEPSYLFVDGRDGTQGPYDLYLMLAAAACGDGVTNEGEQCDFGDTVSGDGCDGNCMIEPPDPTLDVCPGELRAIGADRPLTLMGFNVGYTDDYPPVCESAAGGRDRVIALNPTADGVLTLEASGSFDVVLSVYSDCPPTTLLGCADSPAGPSAEKLSVLVTYGSQYFVVVEGYGDRSGQYSLLATLIP